MNLCFLWHQHQPDYRTDEGFFMPWVRLHGTKDYLDLPKIIADFPLKHTINVVPSLIAQLQSYANGLTDPIQKLHAIHPSKRSADQHRSMRDWICTLQYQTMASPLPALDELWKRLEGGSDTVFSNTLSNQEWTDAEVLFELAWMGQVTRKRAAVERLIEKGSGYSREDLNSLLAEQAKVLAEIVPTMVTLEQQGTIEVTVTPYHHPILPLLINSNVARECMPEAPLPHPPMNELGDAAWNVFAALSQWHHQSGVRPRGMWPAEGSVCMQTLSLMAAANVQWTATDQGVLQRSMGHGYTEASPYMPYVVQTSHGSVRMLFRDHELSDAIGFEYATWHHEDAATDFIQRLHKKREMILRSLPESQHETAVIAVVLDGENCWEYYRNNGETFLRTLFERLSSEQAFTTVTGSEATAGNCLRIPSITAGSWINADFGIWIGDTTKNLAWQALREAREAVHRAGNPDALVTKIRKLEASDYFWWYHKSHGAIHKATFDEVFRRELQTVFNLCNVVPEADLSSSFTVQGSKAEPMIKSFPVNYSKQGSMHISASAVRELIIETQQAWQRVTLTLSRQLSETEWVALRLTDQDGIERTCSVKPNSIHLTSQFDNEGAELGPSESVRLYLHTNSSWVVGITEGTANSTLRTTAFVISQANT